MTTKADLERRKKELELIDELIIARRGAERALTLMDIPEGWREIEQDHPCRPRQVRITANYDEQVAKFYRKMGSGYQKVMNAVLKAYMLSRLSRHILDAREQELEYDKPAGERKLVGEGQRTVSNLQQLP